MTEHVGSRMLVLLAAVLLLGAALLLACQPSQPAATPKPAAGAAAIATKPAEKPVRGGTLRFGAYGEHASLDPAAFTSEHAGSLIYEHLIVQDDDFRLTKEGLFKDWTISGDGKAITFKLREGVKFHDGTDFDAAAVKFIVERLKDPATKATWASNYATVASVEVVDSLTVRFNLSQADPLLLPRLSTSGGLMMSPTAVKKYGQDFGRNPVGSGPFQFVEWLPGDHVTVKRFEGYWGKDKDGVQFPYLDGVLLKPIVDDTTRAASLRTGQVDMASNFPPQHLASLKADPNLTYTAMPNSYFSGVFINTKRPPFDNKALRQAVALTLDGEGIAALQGEGASFAASLFYPMNVGWGVDPKAGAFPARDVAKAKAKMAEAGYPSGGLKVKFTSGNADTAIRQAEVVKANLAEIGIEVEIEVLASAAVTTKVRIEQTYQIGFTGPGSGVADPGPTFGIAYHSRGSRNYAGPYSNPKVDELIDKAGSIYDESERKSLYEQAAKMIVDDVPFIPVIVGHSMFGMNKRVRNFTPYPVTNDLRYFKKVWLAP